MAWQRRPGGLVRYGLAWRALRHRSGQALVLGLLAGIVIAACASGPLYERAVEQASVRATLEHAQVSARGLTVSTAQLPDAAAYHADMGEPRVFYVAKDPTPVTCDELVGHGNRDGAGRADVAGSVERRRGERVVAVRHSCGVPRQLVRRSSQRRT
jgi:hypothetical protein